MIKCFVILMVMSFLFFVGGNLTHIGLYGESIWVLLTDKVRKPEHKALIKAPGAILLQFVSIAGASAFITGLFFAVLCTILLIK